MVHEHDNGAGHGASFCSTMTRVQKRRRRKPATPVIFNVHIGVDPMDTFCDGGGLAVSGAQLVIPVMTAVNRANKHNLRLVGWDFHPKSHGSLASNHKGAQPFSMGKLSGMDQVLWSDHGIQTATGPAGCAFHKDFDLSLIDRIFPKGQDERVDSYSCLFDNGRHASAELKRKYPFLGKSTGMSEYINRKAQEFGATEIVVDVSGLVLPYCVTFTAKDARDQKYRGKNWTVRVIADACAAMGDQAAKDAALADLRAYGCEIINSTDIIGSGK
jgi:nicotinamidase/pyrazinamidase